MNYQFQSLYGSSRYTLQIQYGTYQEGNTSMQLIDCADGFPFATATVNLPGLTENEVAIKNYSENEGVLNFLLDNEIIEAPHRFVQSGFVNIPVCRLK
jgi:hypothetical protein